MKHKGFTIVEVIVVIVVIVILATIVIASYSFMRDDAMDAKIRSTVKTVGDAIVLNEERTGSRISGIGYFSNANSVDTLVPAYLNYGYRNDLTSTNTSSSIQVLRWYNCNNGQGGLVVYASLSSPTSDDTSKFTTIRSACGHNDSQAPTSGTPRYNYAEIF